MSDLLQRAATEYAKLGGAAWRQVPGRGATRLPFGNREKTLQLGGTTGTTQRYQGNNASEKSLHPL
eukprot:3762862-Amphidinium_carterae.3